MDKTDHPITHNRNIRRPDPFVGKVDGVKLSSYLPYLLFIASQYLYGRLLHSQKQGVSSSMQGTIEVV